MFNKSSKRVVVIRDIHSNLIEEAILILKNEPVKKVDTDKCKCLEEGKRDSDYLIKEAEMIIDNFIKENKISFKDNKKAKEKLVAINRKNIISAVINIALIGSLGLLVFIVSKVFQ